MSYEVTGYEIPIHPTFNSFKDFVETANLFKVTMIIKIAMAGPDHGYECFSWWPSKQVLISPWMTVHLYANKTHLDLERGNRKSGFFILKDDPTERHVYMVSDDGLRVFSPPTFNYFGTHPADDLED